MSSYATWPSVLPRLEEQEQKKTLPSIQSNSLKSWSKPLSEMLLGTEGRAWTKRVPRDQAITSCPRLEVLTSLALTNHVHQRLDEPDIVSFHSGMVLLENFEALRGVRLALYQRIGVFFFFSFLF